MKKSGKNVVALIGLFLLCVGLGALFGFGMVWLEDRYFERQLLLWDWIVILALALLFLFIQLIIHEGGHLLFGLATGYTFSSFRVGNFMWVKLDGKIRLKRMSLAGTVGQCLMLPPPYTEKFPVVWYNLGGVLLNLITAVFAVAFTPLCAGVPYLFLSLILFASMGVLLALTNGIPLRIGQVDNDGANTVSLRKNEKARYAFWLQLEINGRIANGERLKDMPAEWFVLPSDEEMKNGMLAAQGAFTENYYMDKHDFAAAKACIEHLLAVDGGFAEVHIQLMKCDLIYLLLLEGEVSGATKLWTKELRAFMQSMKKFPAVLRTQYVYALLAQKDGYKETECLMAFENAARSYPYAADIQSERELIQIIRNQAENAE